MLSKAKSFYNCSQTIPSTVLLSKTNSHHCHSRSANPAKPISKTSARPSKANSFKKRFLYLFSSIPTSISKNDSSMLHRYENFKTDFTAFVIPFNSRLIRPSVISLLLFSLVLYYSFVHKLLSSRSPRAKKCFHIPVLFYQFTIYCDHFNLG